MKNIKNIFARTNWLTLQSIKKAPASHRGKGEGGVFMTEEWKSNILYQTEPEEQLLLAYSIFKIIRILFNL